MADKELIPQQPRPLADPVIQQHKANDAPFIEGVYTEVKPEKVAATSAPQPTSPKIGEGHLAAMARLGLKELAQTLQAFPDSNIRPIEEPGAFGNATPQIVTQQMGVHGYDPGEFIRPTTPEQDKSKGRTR